MGAIVVALSGCASTREYPRCYLFRAPQTPDIARADEDAKQLFASPVRVASFSMSKDMVVATTWSFRHRQLEQVWPELGCVNLRRDPPGTGEMNDKWIVARCQGYLEALLNRERLTPVPPRTEVAAAFREFICN